MAATFSLDLTTLLLKAKGQPLNRALLIKGELRAVRLTYRVLLRGAQRLDRLHLAHVALEVNRYGILLLFVFLLLGALSRPFRLQLLDRCLCITECIMLAV